MPPKQHGKKGETKDLEAAKNEVHVQLKSIRDEATTLLTRLNGTITRLNGTLTRLNGISDALFSATTIEEVHDLRSQLNSIQIHPPVADPSALQSSTAHFAPPIRQSSTTCVTHTLPHFAVIFRLSMEADGSYTLTWICRRIPVSSLCFCLDYTLGLYKLDGPMSLRSVEKKVVIITSAWSNSTAQNMENAVHGVGTRPRVHFPANRLNNLCTIWPPEKRGYPSGWKPPVLVDACGPDQESVTFFLRTRMYCAVKNKEKSLYFAVRMPIATN